MVVLVQDSRLRLCLMFLEGLVRSHLVAHNLVFHRLVLSVETITRNNTDGWCFWRIDMGRDYSGNRYSRNQSADYCAYFGPSQQASRSRSDTVSEQVGHCLGANRPPPVSE